MSRKTRLDLTGQTFGRLTVTKYSHTNKHGFAMWECVCACGNTIVANGCHLRNGHTTSCGCYKSELSGGRLRTHGLKQTRMYRIWLNMKSRCAIPSADSFHRYGERGITVCEEWQSFEAFYQWAMSNGYRDDLTIDRIDNDGNYCPENCRWTTRKVQSNNTSANRFVTYNGETHTLKEWSEIIGVNYCTISSRYHAGRSPEEVLHVGKLSPKRGVK